MRTLLWISGGILLGLAVHLVSILVLPSYASDGLWARVAALAPVDTITVLDPVEAGAPNPLGLDPKLAYAVCRLDLSAGPGVVRGLLPKAFWSVSVYDKSGLSLYSTTNRSSANSVLDLGVFTPQQMRTDAGDQAALTPDMLIVGAPDDAVFVSVRLAPEQPVMLTRYRGVLSQLDCGQLPPAPKAASGAPQSQDTSPSGS